MLHLTFFLFVKESLRGESPGSVDSSSNADDSLDNELGVEEETGEEVKMDVSKQQFSMPDDKQDEAEEEKDEENEMGQRIAADSKGIEQSERSREDHDRPLKSTTEESGNLKMEDVPQDTHISEQKVFCFHFVSLENEDHSSNHH